MRERGVSRRDGQTARGAKSAPRDCVGLDRSLGGTEPDKDRDLQGDHYAGPTVSIRPAQPNSGPLHSIF